ncbi:uncharacterized protein PB18E9.04c-like isoform X2 [Acanthopagrus latus]|uniref:uncharacterized protein PB18E9.04c-like isoform X2 n=1 Tax=Acanthopagrus latus TaxID=8177 RepID=UPI00187CEB87|nr:uncharacterized protein PB18E9.04c-like isoform X2 [Acanthopagrus latus]
MPIKVQAIRLDLLRENMEMTGDVKIINRQVGVEEREALTQGPQESGFTFMTQEFKDQNALVVDGRSLCRHFLYGRCIKGDDCQMEHVQSYNNLIKELCKFYVQGFCSKGDSCPYMHSSFPCKFFHRKGKCSQGEHCRFSHELLNEITSKLLDEAVKRESDLTELAKKAEQESTGQPDDTDESKIMEATTTPDVLKQPLRPNFYRSGDTNAEQEALLGQPEEVINNTVEAVPPHASNADQPQSPPSANLTKEEPVCYSVEAVLGPQLSKPFSRFLTTPRSQGSAPLTTSDCRTGSANQSEVPYSVDAVLRSCKSVEHSSFGDKPIRPTAQTASLTPRSHFEEITDAQLSSETPDKEVLNSVHTRKETNKPKERLFKSLPSLQVHTGLVSETFPNCTVAYGDNRKQAARTASHGVKSELLSTDRTYSVTCKGEGVLPSGPSSQMSSSKHPAQLRPHLSGLLSDSQGSFKPFCPSSGPIKLNDSAVPVSHYLTPKQPTKIYMYSKETQSGRNLGSKQHYSTETKAECGREMVHCADSSVECKKTRKSPYRSLFASPITDTSQPIDNCVTSSSCCHDLVQPSCTAPQTSDSRGTHLKTTLEPDKASARPFQSLFSAPLSATPLARVQPQPNYSKTNSCSKQSVHSLVTTSLSPDSKQKASNIEEPLQYPVSHTPKSPDFSSDAEMGKDGSSGHINQPVKQLVNPVCGLVSSSPACSGDSPSTTTAHRHKGSAKTTATNSVLKTLFLSLSPYHQDGEHQDRVTLGIEEKDKSSTRGVFVKQQQNNKFKNQDSHKQSTEKSGAHSRQHQPFLWTPQISLEATGWSTLSCPGTMEFQVRDSSIQNSPVVPLIEHDTQPRLKNTSEEATCVNGNATATPLKDLFKTLDTSVIHSGI